MPYTFTLHIGLFYKLGSIYLTEALKGIQKNKLRQMVDNSQQGLHHKQQNKWQTRLSQVHSMLINPSVHKQPVRVSISWVVHPVRSSAIEIVLCYYYKKLSSPQSEKPLDWWESIVSVHYQPHILL